MNKQERGELMNKRALEMARSGTYDDWYAIERALRSEGFREARQWLDDRFLRSEFDEMCRQAKEGKTPRTQ